MKIVEKDKESLEEAKSIAESFIQKENEKAAIECKLFQYFQNSCHKNVESASQKRDEVEMQLKEEKLKLEEFKEALKALEKQFESETKVYDEIVKVAERSKADFAAFERKDIKFREELKHAKSKDKKTGKAIEKEELSLSEQRTWLCNYENDVQKHQLELANLKKKLESAESV